MRFLGTPSSGMCGTNSNHGFQRSQTDIVLGSPCGTGNRSPNSIFPCLPNSNASHNWSLQRKPSLEQQFGGGFGFGTSPPQMEGPVVFLAPELTQETLMEVKIK